MADFYSNENFPLPVVEELRRLGHHVLTIQETGKSGLALRDEQVLAYATRHKRILLTINRRHFVRLHQSHAIHAGIIVCSFDPDFSGQAKRIHEAVGKLSNSAGQLIRVNRPS